MISYFSTTLFRATWTATVADLTGHPVPDLTHFAHRATAALSRAGASVRSAGRSLRWCVEGVAVVVVAVLLVLPAAWEYLRWTTP